MDSNAEFIMKKYLSGVNTEPDDVSDEVMSKILNNGTFGKYSLIKSQKEKIKQYKIENVNLAQKLHKLRNQNVKRNINLDERLTNVMDLAYHCDPSILQEAIDELREENVNEIYDEDVLNLIECSILDSDQSEGEEENEDEENESDGENDTEESDTLGDDTEDMEFKVHQVDEDGEEESDSDEMEMEKEVDFELEIENEIHSFELVKLNTV